VVASDSMAHVRSAYLVEAEELLREVLSWTDEEVEELPKLYRDQARKFRQRAKGGEG